MRKNLFVGVIISVAVSLSTAIILESNKNNFKKVSGSTCSHNHIEEYFAYAPTVNNKGEMHHYACCECHTAWSDSELTNEIGNTITNRSKIDIPKKSSITKIDKNMVGDDLIKNVVNTSPYVVGLDQTTWSSASNGKGPGNIFFYNIDNKNAIRLSTETLNSQKRQLLDTYNNGYSEFSVTNDIIGQVTASFEYKYYDLDDDFYATNHKLAISWINEEGSLITQNDIELIPDNSWHTVVISSNSPVNLHLFTVKIHHFYGELYISNLSMTAPKLDAPVLYQYKQGVKFNTVQNADYYLVHDSNNNPSEIKIVDSESDNGVITYHPTAAGFHDIYVTAHKDDVSYSPSTSNVIHNIEVAPVFYYDNFANEYYVQKSYFEAKSKWSLSNLNHELYKNKNKFFLTEDGNYYQTYVNENGEFTTNKDERMSFLTYEEGTSLYEIMQNAKELGTNVINVSHSDGILTSTQSLEDNLELKAIMDAAYLNNLKVTVIANEIYGPSASGTSEQAIRNQIYNYLNNYGESLITHPAFYGFVLRDEPRPNVGDIEKVSWAAKACIDYFDDNYYTKNLSVRCPFFVCALLQFTTASDGLFQTKEAYKEYVETWLTLTGLNYYSTDIYTYTTQSYGDSNEITQDNYDIYLDLKSKYNGLRYHLTVTSNNDIDNRASCNAYDIFGSTLYAAAFNNYGVSRYTYFPAIWTYHWKNGIVNRDGSKTTNYSYAKKAQSQFEFLQNELYGYIPISMTYSSNGNYGANSANTRIIETELSNGFNNCSITVNYNSQSNYNSTYQKFVPSGLIYYMLGNNYSISPIISTGINVTLNNGEAVYITQEEETYRDVVMDYKEIAGNFGEIGSDTSDLDVDVSNNYLDLTITGNNPGVWLNRNLNGASTFIDAVNCSNGFDLVFKTLPNKSASIRIVEKVGNNYIGKNYSMNGQTTGNWDTIEIRDLDVLDAIRMEFIGEFASNSSLIQIKEIVFKDVEGPYLTFEAKHEAYVIDKLNQISGFSSSQVAITSNSEYESDMTYQMSSTNSYIFKFKYSYSTKVDSIFFFIGCQSWKGFEFIILSNKHTQIDIYDDNGTYVCGSGQSFYEIEKTDTDYDVEFDVIRLKDGSNRVYLSITVNGLLWNQMLINEPSGCKNNVIGIYDYGASGGAGTILKDF